MKMNCAYSVLFLVVMTTTEILATQHEVTWDVSTDLNSWASGRTFKVGDQLVFKYSSGLHSVLELSSEKEYKSCDIGNALNSMNGGKDVVKLTKSGTRYFACGTMGHCDQGMKLAVKTVGAGDSPAQDSPSSGSSSDSPSSSDSSSKDSSPSSTSAAHGSSSVAGLSVVAVSVIAGLFNVLF